MRASTLAIFLPSFFNASKTWLIAEARQVDLSFSLHSYTIYTHTHSDAHGYGLRLWSHSQSGSGSGTQILICIIPTQRYIVYRLSPPSPHTITLTLAL